MLPRSISSLYDHLRDFVVYEEAGTILGICALQLCWDDLAEIRSLAVVEKRQKCGIGALLVESCLDEAHSLEISKVFVLTYQAPLIVFIAPSFRTAMKMHLFAPHQPLSNLDFCALTLVCTFVDRLA